MNQDNHDEDQDIDQNDWDDNQDDQDYDQDDDDKDFDQDGHDDQGEVELSSSWWRGMSQNSHIHL